MQDKFFIFFICILLFSQLIIIPQNNADFIERDHSISIFKQKNTPNFFNYSITEVSNYFIKNCGQIDNEEIRFYEFGHRIWFTDDGVWFDIKQELNPPKNKSQKNDILFWQDSGVNNDELNSIDYERLIVKQEFFGANDVRPNGNQEQSWKSNYFIGNCTNDWVTNVPSYQEIYYQNLYNGIDLRYYKNENGLKYDFIVHPGANPDLIQIKYCGIDGLEINDNDNLIIKTRIMDIIDSDLFIYQYDDNVKIEIKGKFKLLDNTTYGFQILEKYNIDNILIIDPKVNLEYSTFIGSAESDGCGDIATDHFGNAYFITTTSSSNFPVTPGAYCINYNGGNNDLLILKMNWNGSNLIYATYIGGNDKETGSGIKVASSGDCYFTGGTWSNDFPTTPGANDTSHNGKSDIFVTKLNHSGSKLIFSSYIGGSGDDSGSAIEIDNIGNSFITGNTVSTNFPVTQSANDTSHNGLSDGFILKLNPIGSKIIYATYFGGTKIDRGYDNVSVVFRTSANDSLTLAENGSYISNGTDGKLDYINGTGIAVLYNKIYHKLYGDGYWYDVNNDNEERPHGVGDWLITEIYRYNYSSNQTAPDENDLYNISLNYSEFPDYYDFDIPILEDSDDNPVFTKYLNITTPDGYNVYLEDPDGTPDINDNIIIKLNDNTYVRYQPDSSISINNSIYSIPKNSPSDPNYVANHQEFYDYRLALNIDNDFDGISNTEELLFGTNPYDADTDNDGLDDGEELDFGSDPNNKDPDNDGLNDSEEYSFRKERYGEVNGADPWVKDIFIEVDWMKKTKKVERPNSDLCLIGPLFGTTTKTITDIEYKLPDIIKEEIVPVFKKKTVLKEKIMLHIDDGIYGGGTSIKYYEFLDWPTTFNLNNPGHIGKEKIYEEEFDTSHQGIFHYLILCDSIYVNSRGLIFTITSGGIGDMNCHDWNGEKAEPRKDGIIMAIANKDKMSNIYFAKVFMHELGHNLGLFHVDDSTKHPGIELWGSENYSDTVMMKKAIEAKDYDYLMDEWEGSDGDGIDLSYSLKGISSFI